MATTLYVPSARSSNSDGIQHLTTELDSIANGSLVTMSSAVSNDAEQDTHAFFELLIGHGTAPTADREWRLFALPTIDGTNFAYATATRMPMDFYLGSFFMNNETTARRYMLGGPRRPLAIPPRDFKLALLNDAGQTSASSGNILTGYYYNFGT